MLSLALMVASEPPLDVVIYAGPGTVAEERERLAEELSQAPGLAVRQADATGLAGAAVLLVSGDSASALARGLGAEGCAAIAAFVRQGGGYVGLGAGAYLPVLGYNAPTRQLVMVNAMAPFYPDWQPAAPVSSGIVYTRNLATPLGRLPEMWQLGRGPVFRPAQLHGLPPYQAVMQHRVNLRNTVLKAQARSADPEDAIIAAGYGQGRVILFGVDPLALASTRPALAAAVRWAGEAAPWSTPTAPEQPGALRVAVMDDSGSSPNTVRDLFTVLGQWPERFALSRLTTAQVAAGDLRSYAVFIFPGGAASAQLGALGEPGCAAIRQYVRDGGGFLGICAGAIAALSSATGTSTRLGLAAVANARDVTYPRIATLRCRTTERFREITGCTAEELDIYHHNGPVMAPIDVPDLPAAEPLLYFAESAVPDEAQPDAVVGRLAAVTGNYGAGRVVLYSSHLEHTGNLNELVCRTVEHLGGR